MELDNGDFDPSDPEGPYPVGTVIKYRCDRGYKFGTRYTSVTCQLQPDKMSAKFSKLPVCERVYCMFPGEPANGKTTPKKVRYIVDETVEFECDKCYSRKGASSATCQQNEQFSAQVPSCNIIKCAKTKIDIPYKGYLAVPKKEYNCGERVDFKCEYGYRRVGVGSTVCRPSGAFDPSETTCEAITCKLVITDKNLRVTPFKPGLEYFVDMTVKFRCRLGYEIKKGDPTSSTCEVSGEFSNPAPSCIPVTCGKPPVPEYGSIVDYDGETSYKPGSYVEYQCKKYYTLAYDESGGSNLCLHDGTWKYPAPKCLPPSCDGYCFADYIKGRECQCDHACDDKDRKDCCDDRKKYCSTKSCGGRCGTRGPGCSCHITCQNALKTPGILPCCRDFYAGCNDWYQF